MFRRFMTVCWVLFAMAALTAVIGWSGYSHYQREIEEARIVDIDDLTTEATEEWRIFEPGEDSDTSPGRPMTPEEIKDFNLSMQLEHEQSINDKIRPIRVQRERYSIALGLGGLIAAILLLWNIIWHTGHWVSEGRET